ncbi:hypothetical protein BDZ90DRAFT_56215 [Jaminaea rosea]|uniref:Uncharacterized protein n=1 Tax=Jaminaea rosea TaxID=1569628 RepID=A0A316UQ38_9BASI|nr:hypothetical protein BDZ90DRAFT_56215 [Jaminaea rosea]PWN25993.1 hypothetical protein BDZ90DRAFT_56215 [Jaminaea rosea]
MSLAAAISLRSFPPRMPCLDCLALLAQTQTKTPRGLQASQSTHERESRSRRADDADLNRPTKTKTNFETRHAMALNIDETQRTTQQMRRNAATASTQQSVRASVC